MKIKTQLFFAQLPTLLIIGFITWLFIFFILALRDKADIILVQNFKTISSIDTIHKYLEELNELYIENPQIILSEPEKLKSLKTKIDQQLLIQEKNIKNEEEKKLTNKLEENWKAYQLQISSSSPTLTSTKQEKYKEIKEILDVIDTLNLESLSQTRENFTSFISYFITFILIATSISLLFGLYLSWFFSGLFLKPFSTMRETMRQIGTEEKTIFLNLKGSEEIEKLSNEFNLMSVRLQGFQKDSLQKAFENYQTIKDALDSWPEPILILNQISNFTCVNKAAHKILKLPQDLNKIPSLFHVKTEWKAPLLNICNTVLTTKNRYHPNKEKDVLSLIVDDKKAFYLPWAYPIKKFDTDYPGSLEGVFIILQDLLHKPLSSETKVDAYERIAHNFQSPLNDVRMAIHLCTEGAVGPLTDKQQEILISTREKCDQLAKLTQSLLSLSTHMKKEFPSVQNVDLSSILSNLIKSAKLEAEKKNTSILFETSPYLTPLKANREEVETILRNLLQNAVYYATPDSEIKVTLQEIDNKFIEFSVTNQGHLIPPEYRKNIFKKNFKIPGQPKKRAGLGLYIAKKSVQGMKGKIGFRNAGKNGTIFWVKFPLSPTT
ncbi:ATP-binding protein [Geitlerinema splendidum]|nr:ATP-binding protein [Geitlerinema splendidum]